MNKKFKRLAAALLLIAAMCFAGVGALAATEYSEGYFKYVIENESVSITSYFGSEKEVVIPERIASLPVTEIRGNAFMRNKTVTVLTIPETVTSIGDGAFTQMKGLKKIILQSKSVKVKAPDGCVVVEDYPVYITPSKPDDSSGTASDNSSTPAPADNSGAGTTDSSADTSSGGVQSEVQSGSQNGLREAGNAYGDNRPKISAKNGYVTVDDSGNLIFIDSDNNLAIIDGSGGYTFSTDGDIIDAAGKRVTVDYDADTVSYTGSDGKTVTRKLGELEFVREKGSAAEKTAKSGKAADGKNSGACVWLIIAVSVAVAAVCVAVIIIIKKRKQKKV